MGDVASWAAHRRGVHQPHCRAAIWADLDPRPPWLSGRKHLSLARLPYERLQRISGHHPDTERQGRLLAPRGVGNDPRCNAAPGRPVLLRLRSRRPRLLKRTRVPVGSTTPDLVGALAGTRSAPVRSDKLKVPDRARSEG